MADPSIIVVGHGNIVGNYLTNVGNQTINYNIHPPERVTLESVVSFDALLNAAARYPAPKCHPATRKVAQKVVKNWLCRKGEGSEKGIMWMSGAPGVGKSAIAQTVCEELCADDGSQSWLSRVLFRIRHVDGTFFFGRGLENREKASFFPSTIAYQLSRSRSSCRTAINRTIESRPTILGEDFPSQFRQLLIKSAQQTGFFEGPITVVIDGLDECNSVPDQVALLELIFEAVKTRNMRFFIASRPEQHIHAFFHRRDVSQHTFHIKLDEETFNTSQDIQVFLREEFARIREARPEECPKMANGEEWPGNIVISDLTAESDCQFMFPTLAVGFIDTPFFSPVKQLQILMAAPHSRAFSALDALYHKILSRRPPAQLLQGEDDLSDYQVLVVGILWVIIAWPGDPLSAAKIAAVLDKPVDVVQNIVRGPMRSLFKFHTSKPDSPISLCHKSLRDYLLDRKRSEEFFIPSTKPDDLFVAILSRQPSFYPLHPYSRDIVMDVLALVGIAEKREKWSVSRIAAFLDVDATFVGHVVGVGPTNLLFSVKQGGVVLSSEAFGTFLRDADRSGVFFISNSRVDTLFIRFLSRYNMAPSDPSSSYSRDVLLDILAVTRDFSQLKERPTICQIAALLAVDSSLVEHVVRFGGTKWLFGVDELDRVTSSAWLDDFQRDAERSREFFVSDRRIDTVFIRIISCPSPPEPSQSPSHSHDILMSVLTAIVVFRATLSARGIASVLNVDHTLIEGVLKFGPTNLLFGVGKDEDDVTFSASPLLSFLVDADRSGEFYISLERINTLFIHALSRGAASASSDPHSRELFMDVLTVVFMTESWSCWTISQIAAFLNVDPGLVEGVVFGPTKELFHVADNKVQFSTVYIGHFLQDVDRAGDFCITERRVDTLLIPILSRQPPSDPSRSYSRDVLMSILAAMVSLPIGLTLRELAFIVGVDPYNQIIDINPQVIEHVILGPLKPLFEVESTNRIRFSTKSLAPALMNADRSGEFFISCERIDPLFTLILSLQLRWDRSQTHCRDILMGILTILANTDWDRRWTDPAQLAAFLDVAPPSVESITHIGPSKLLFGMDYSYLKFSPVWRDPTMQGGIASLRLFLSPRYSPIVFSTPLLGPFLKDANRSGEFFISEKSIDPFFTRILSSPPPPVGSPSYSRRVLMDVLTMTLVAPGALTVSAVAAALDVNPSFVEGVVRLGLTRLLFNGADKIVFFASSLGPFFRDAERSGEFYISDPAIDALFIRILSLPPPPNLSHPHSKDILLGVIAAILVSPASLTVPEIATLLHIDPSLVEGIVRLGPAKVFFDVDEAYKVAISVPLLKPFLQDSSARSGEFFIPPTMSLDAISKPWLQNPSDSM